MKIATGTAVSFHYTLRDQHGEVLDSSRDRESPLTYLHGHDNIIPGLEHRLEGLETGDRAKLDVPAAEAYGEHRAELLTEVARDRFSPEVDLTVGGHVMAEGGERPVPLTIVEVSESVVVLDANHPMAGRDLHFDIEIMEVREATPEEVSHGHVHDGHHHH